MPGGNGPRPILTCRTTGGAMVAEIRADDPAEQYLEAVAIAVDWQLVMTEERRRSCCFVVLPDSDLRMARVPEYDS